MTSQTSFDQTTATWETVPETTRETLARPRPSDREVARMVQLYGGPVSTALLDSSCPVFRIAGVDGVIGYRSQWGAAVAIGDPVCAAEDKPRLATAFREFCLERGWHTAYAVASEGFADHCRAAGYAALEFGCELILDPKRDPQAGSAGRELRKKVNRARKEGLEVHEYRLTEARDEDLEREMEKVAKDWLRARQGPQIFLMNVSLFSQRNGLRWFFARHGGRIVGVLSLVKLDALCGYLLDHLLATPDAPIGTTESLVTSALAVLGDEGCEVATWGAAPSCELGRIDNLGSLSERIARTVFRASGKVFHLDARTRYRQKFQVARVAPSYLLFQPPQIGPREVVGLMRAFNISLA